MERRRSFLFEIGTEELPPKALLSLSKALGDAIARGLRKAQLGFEELKSYASPRRLAVTVERLVEDQPDTVEERRGPSLTAAFDENGEPTQAARGFARSCGVELDALETLETGKGAWLVFRKESRGRSVRELLPGIVIEALNELPIPRRMRWGSLEASFVRPVHWLVLLYGDEVIDCELFGLAAGRETRGHRFHHPGALYLSEPAAYVPLLETEGRVIVDFSMRREAVRAQVTEAAAGVRGCAEIDEALLDEVTGMVEWPAAVIGRFEDRFLEIPDEALISAMKLHQKYFHLRDERGALMPYFITVSNIESRDIDVVRAGNERVIRPRLSDAMFFWDQDRKRRLDARIDDLRDVVFQRRLGTLYQKSERVAALSRDIAERLDGNTIWAERAAWLSKCDLLTEMVGEFPELQGVMGRYYALHDKEPEEIAQALAEQYLPRSAGEELPKSMTGRVLAIADKIDTLAGIFTIGLIPSGDKDPFALRRAALGALRIMIECGRSLDLNTLLDSALQAFRDQGVSGNADDVKEQLYVFMMDRLRAIYQDSGLGPEVFEAVWSRRPTCPADFDARIRAVQVFRRLPEAESLAAANKRIANILRKSEEEIPDRIDRSLLQESAEKALARALEKRIEEASPLIERGEYTEVLKRLAGLRPDVDVFFSEVLVMSEDPAVRRNRLALLRSMHRLFMQVADLSCLSTQSDSRS